MPDPISLTIVGTVALTEGIKFLYAQGGEVLKRWSARRAEAKKAQSELKNNEPANVQLPAVFEGQLVAPEVNFNEVERLHEPLLELRSKLVNYAEGVLPLEGSNADILDAAAKLRSILEAIYQQRITFKGENRESSGTRVTTRLKVEDVRGTLTGTEIDELSGGEVNTVVEAGDIEPDGEVTGTKIRKMGDRR